MRFLLFLSCLVFSLTASARDSDAVLRGKVMRVTDGDTAQLKLQSGAITVRFYGIDAPEKNQPYGMEAASALRQLIGGKVVDLIPVEQDKYDRLVAVVMLGERNVNLEMVARGNAWAFRQYLGEFRDDPLYCEWEAKARDQQLGLWRSTGRKRHAPWEWRHRDSGGPYTDYEGSTMADCVAAIRAAPASAPVPAGRKSGDCLIKGNIGSGGKRIYHVPGSASYANTRIDESKGERWFCSEAEARAAGFRAPRN
ncbi:MAG: thermonuclease family protein [Gammaproteobacteria bacterium]|nr:thermonuclease family protein [Gammaproteobacteria bacterium]MCP5140682.1 thermonuclease family protein [Chromatiales bacterium]